MSEPDDDRSHIVFIQGLAFLWTVTVLIATGVHLLYPDRFPVIPRGMFISAIGTIVILLFVLCSEYLQKRYLQKRGKGS